ncbi:MAG: ASPIC/UnbV domain-containing protein [bacterium]|nr:ASPIC/UnbV domain-containing protein [bacterium]
MSGQTGYCGQSLDIHYGLGSSTEVDSIRVFWPGGLTEEYNFIDANQTYTITQGVGMVNVDERETPVVKDQLLSSRFRIHSTRMLRLKRHCLLAG